MIKKILAFGLIGAMLLGTACSRSVPQADTTTPKSDTASTTQDGTKATTAPSSADLTPEEGAKLVYWAENTDFAQKAAEEFTKQYGIPVEVEQVGFDVMDKIMLDGPAGNGPDVFWGNNDLFPKGYDAGLFLKIDDSIAATVKEETNQIALGTVTVGDQIYGIPLTVETMALLYNKDIVETPATTFEEIMEKAPEFNKQGSDYYYFLTPIGGYTLQPFFTASGFELFGADGQDMDHPGFDSPAFVDGLTAVSKLKEIIPIAAADLKMDSSNALQQSFIDGKTAYLPNGPWVIQALKDSGMNFGITTYPTLNGKDMMPFGGVKSTHVSAFSKYPIAAQLFAQFLASKECAALMFETQSLLTARNDYATIPGLKDDPMMLTFAQQFEKVSPTPSNKRIAYFWTISETVYGAVFDGQMTPADGSAKAQTDFEALVASE